MSKKPEHLYLDEHGVLHAPECAVTKAAWRSRLSRQIPCTQRGGDGPAQVATADYRDGWTRIFGKDAEVGQA